MIGENLRLDEFGFEFEENAGITEKPSVGLNGEKDNSRPFDIENIPIEDIPIEFFRNCGNVSDEEEAELDEELNDLLCSLLGVERISSIVEDSVLIVGSTAIRTKSDMSEFDRAVWITAASLAETIIEKNRNYGEAYWKVREACKEKYGEIGAGIPYFVHSFEKASRSERGCEEDKEDADWDALGYHFLEYVCMVIDRANAEQPKNEDISKYLRGRDPKHYKNCVVCGKPLKGLQRKFCSKKCNYIDYNNWKLNKSERYEVTCAVCEKVFRTYAPTIKTCCRQCATELRARTILENKYGKRRSE